MNYQTDRKIPVCIRLREAQVKELREFAELLEVRLTTIVDKAIEKELIKLRKSQA